MEAKAAAAATAAGVGPADRALAQNTGHQSTKRSEGETP